MNIYSLPFSYWIFAFILVYIYSFLYSFPLSQHDFVIHMVSFFVVLCFLKIVVKIQSLISFHDLFENIDVMKMQIRDFQNVFHYEWRGIEYRNTRTNVPNIWGVKKPHHLQSTHTLLFIIVLSICWIATVTKRGWIYVSTISIIMIERSKRATVYNCWINIDVSGHPRKYANEIVVILHYFDFCFRDIQAPCFIQSILLNLNL